MSCPQTTRRFSEGRISVDQAAAAARFVPAEFEASVAQMAESATAAQLVRSTKEYDFDTDAPDRDDAPEPTPKEPVPEAPDRGVERSVSLGPMTVVSGGRRSSSPPDEGMEVEAAWRAERDRLIEAGRKAARARAAAAKAQADGDDGRAATDGSEPSGQASWLPAWADALMGVVRSAIANSGAETWAGSGPSNT